ncbi:hypothetical protein VTJ83DRAFT_407 [Remersonia thermophila]|uniref:Uncharacterized protein n=1 Tax=Remersonia thermophila TaxID=72144 RepID=A0ABR4DKW2_9PEZI
MAASDDQQTPSRFSQSVSLSGIHEPPRALSRLDRTPIWGFAAIMAPSHDRSLLDRLNALKPTSLSLEKPTDTSSPHPPPGAQPASREDALAARLRSLRERSGSAGPETTAARPAALDDGSGTGKPILQGKVPGETSSRDGTAQPALGGSPRGAASPPSTSSYRFAALEAVDDAAVDELLEALADEDLDLGEGEKEEEAEKEQGAAESLVVGDDAVTRPQDLERLLRSLRLGSGDPACATAKPPPGGNGGGEGGDGGVPGDSDDSDGEPMTREVETILARLGDEISSLPPPSSPAASQERRNTTITTTTTAAAAGDDDETSSSPVALPDVPSAQPANDDPSAPDRSFASRLAQLRGLGPLDALGLPSAPTFLPSDGGSPQGRGLLRSRTRYTDADQRGWCVVCLEDATMRCLGCSITHGGSGGGGSVGEDGGEGEDAGDAYCARCWREMHVGPSAGYDERGHRWVRLDGQVGRPGMYE